MLIKAINWFRTIVVSALLIWSSAAAADVWDEVSHHYADNNGTKIHYVAMGKGPLVVMIHGFPDFWYSWRHQMAGLAADHRVVAIDQRGYNKSDKPKGDENYVVANLVSDVAAVIRDQGADSAVIVGHDWGGVVAWNFAFALPQMTNRLIVLNLPHPNGMARELTHNEEQQRNSDYARRFREGKPSDPDIMFGGPMTAQTLAGWVKDPVVRSRYEAAFAQSDFDAMLAYYKMNYPQPLEPGQEAPAAPRLNMPVLVFHGLKDVALHSDGLNNTWDWIDADLTIVTTPNAGHFVQDDAPELVTSTMKWWLAARRDD